MTEAARNHRKIASNIRELVVNPFSKWCDQHAARVQNSQDDLQGRIKVHDRQAETVRQYRSAYYNKCRRVEDLDEEEKLAFQEPSSAPGTVSGSPPPGQNVPSIKVEDQEDEPEPIEIGDHTYQPDELKKVLTHALDTIKLGETKVPILGTYQNVSTGADITEYIQKHMGGTSVSYAERIGQDLINHGFLRLIGNMGNTFANSSRMNYQWRTKTFQLTGVPEKRPKLTGRTSTLASSTGSDSSVLPDGQVIGDRVSEYLGGWNPLNNAHPNETPGERLRREARDADERYKAAVRKLDGLRCNLEEAMVDHLKFMERCELDRLKAIKSVVLDFSGAISNVIPSLQSTVDNMMLFQETVQPMGDLRYLLENYRTGSYIPRVTTYENYYNQVDEQTFGVDIEARARSDRKRVPLIVTSMLTYLDSHYPDLEGDEARRSIWVVDVPLAATHHLRNQINTGKPIAPQLLEKYEIPIVAAVLKLYFLELPDSLVSSHVYEIVKTIYATTAQSASEGARVQVIQSTLGQLRLANIATLDALITHFTRLLDLTSADDAFVSTLATALAPCILRPKQESGLSMTEKYNVRLVRDLLAHKEAIFGELKRQSSLTHTNSGATRQARAISTDESKRREHMEERQRAIAAAQQAQASAGSSKIRQPSPGPGARAPLADGSMHRRDRSRGPETRFPVATASIQSPTTKSVMSPASTGSSNRDSLLSVPQSPPATRQQPAAATPASPPRQQQQRASPPTSASGQDAPLRTNGSIHQPPPAEEPDESPPSTAQMLNNLRNNSVDSSSTAPTSTSNVKALTSKYKAMNTDADPSSTSTASGADDAPTKRDSLNRTAVRKLQRKGTGRLQRQSIVTSGASNRDSFEGFNFTESPFAADDSAAAAGGDANPNRQSAGVQLEDKPMDFD